MAITWATESFAQPNSYIIRDMVWADTLGLFVAVGQKSSSPNTSCVMTSPDGITWTVQTGTEANNWRGIAWSPDLALLVAVSNNGTHRVMTSHDGVNWSIASAAAANAWQSVTWSPALSLFVAVSDSVTNIATTIDNVMSSPDGVNWTIHTNLTGPFRTWNSIRWVPELALFVAVGESSPAGTGYSMVSPDGTVTWTQSAGIAISVWGGTACGNSIMAWSASLGLLAAVAETNLPLAGNYGIVTSPDGLVWTIQTLPAGANQLVSVVWHQGTAPIIVSDQGTGHKVMRGIASSSAGQFVAVGQGFSQTVVVSTNGTAWTLDANELPSNLADVSVTGSVSAQLTQLPIQIVYDANLLSPFVTGDDNGWNTVSAVAVDAAVGTPATTGGGTEVAGGAASGGGGGPAGGGVCNVCTTLSAAVGFLAARLEDAGKVHWIDAELQRYLIEAIRTWNALTQSSRAQVQFTVVASQAFYDLPTTIPTLRAYTVTDTYLMVDLEYALMEPAVTTSPWTGSEQFTYDDLVEAMEHRRDQFLLETGIVQFHDTQVVSVAPANGRVLLVDQWMTLRRVAWIDSNSVVSPLHRDDEWAFNAFNLAWPSEAGDPTMAPPVSYSVGVTPPFTIQIAPPISATGTLDLVGIARASVMGQNGPCLDPTTGIFLGVPDDWTWVVKFGALADLFSQQGLAYDRPRAEYCEARWKQGIALATKSSVVLAARINGSPVQMPSLSDVDCFDRNWQTTPGSPLSVLLIGTNMVALDPPPVGATDTVLLDVVRNMPIPASTTDCLGVEGWILDVILDYAMHLAMVKEGGSQLSDSLPLLDRFMRLAGVTEKLDQAAVPNRGPILQQTAQSERVLSRVETVEAS